MPNLSLGPKLPLLLICYRASERSLPYFRRWNPYHDSASNPDELDERILSNFHV